MKLEFKQILLAVLMPLAVYSAFGIETLSSSDVGKTLENGKIYQLTSSLILNGQGYNKPGLSVAENSTAAIYIPKGMTLTLYGANGSGKTAGKAGLCIPRSSTLVVVGEGMIVGNGGNAGSAGNGKNGKDGKNDGRDLSSGAGGAGGDGAGGAGAGIGGNGGDGGSGGSETAGWNVDDWYPHYTGKWGWSGSSGYSGSDMGNLYALSSISIYGYCGMVDSAPGLGGTKGSRIDNEHVLSTGMAVGVGGGGGGGGGGAASQTEPADIGGGSGGGGGGGSGGSGGLEYNTNFAWSDDPYGPTGQGGFGGNSDGGNGTPDEPYKGTIHNDAVGGNGGYGGSVGGKGGDGKIYASENAAIYGGDVAEIRETHDILRRTLNFDFQGGNINGATTEQRSVYLFLSMTDAPVPSRELYMFKGFYTETNGRGTQLFDETGLPKIDIWPYDDLTTLYAYWVEVQVPPSIRGRELEVTVTNDEPFDQTRPYVTLRAAVTFASLLSDARNPDGTKGKITFAESLWNNRDEVTLKVDYGVIHAAENRFTAENPLIIQGPSRTNCVLKIDASNKSAILDIGENNHVIMQDLEFYRGNSSNNGGALTLKSGALTVTNCVFRNNVAATGGGAIAADNCESVKLLNCRFDSNEANGKNNGGGAVSVGRSLFADNVTFWANKGTFGGAIKAADNTLAVNCSFFKNAAYQTGGGVYHNHANGMLSLFNCTMYANIANDQDDRDDARFYGGGGVYMAGGANATLNIVNSILVGNRDESLDYPDVQFGASPPATKNFYCSMFGRANPYVIANTGRRVFTGKQARKTFEFGEREAAYGSSVKRGVKHAYLMTEDSDGDVGYTIWHDKDWQSVALSTSRTAAKGPLFGSAQSATIRVKEDISSRDLSDYDLQSQAGSFWYIHDHPERGLIVTKGDDVSNYLDGLLTLREILEGIAKETPIWRSNMVDGVYHVKFSDKIANSVIKLDAAQMQIRGNSNDVEVVVDGADKNVSLNIALDGVGLHRAFTVARGSTLRVNNLIFTNCVGRAEGMNGHEGCDGGAIHNLGSLYVDNCKFMDCSAGNSAAAPVGFGGAIANGNSTTNGTIAIVNNSDFIRCRSARGGAIYNYEGSQITCNGCNFYTNGVWNSNLLAFQSAGGAIFAEKQSTIAYSGCTFTENTIEIDGYVITNNIDYVVDDYHTVSFVNGSATVALNAFAAPELGGNSSPIDFDFSPTEVAVTPGNVKPLLYYGLGYTTELNRGFSVETWVQADALGRLPQVLTAPKFDNCGFYRIFVKEIVEEKNL